MNPPRTKTSTDCRQTAWSLGVCFSLLLVKLWRVVLKTWNGAAISSDMRIVPFQCAMVHDFKFTPRLSVL